MSVELKIVSGREEVKPNNITLKFFLEYDSEEIDLMCVDNDNEEWCVLKLAKNQEGVVIRRYEDIDPDVGIAVDEEGKIKNEEDL